MAMPSGNMILPDKMPLLGGGGVGVVGGGASGEVHQHHLRQWFPDERDGFISWLRAEFAAANAIIDSLCHHLRAVGERGEYDLVVGCIEQRRCNWNSVLYMQQYFPVAEVVYALQQVTLKRQQRYLDPVMRPSKDLRRFPMGSKQSHWVDHTKKVQVANVEVKSEGELDNFDGKSSASMEEKNDTVVKDQKDEKSNSTEIAVGSADDTEPLVEGAGDGHSSSHEDNNLESFQDKPEKQSAAIVPKTFVAPEIFDGKTVINVVDGLKLYEKLFDDAEVSKLVSSVNNLRNAGKKGQLSGQTYVVSKKPSKGHGREMIQLGVTMAEASADDDKAAGMSKDGKIESIPSSIQDVIERLVNMQVTNVKPDCCIIDFYNEGDHSQPHVLPPWYGRPVLVIFLTECQMSFGRVIGIDRPGDFRGSLKLSLSSGSLLVMEGNSTDFAKHAIYSSRKQRMLITLTKSLPKKGGDTPSSSSTGTPNWSPSPSWSPNHVRHSMGHKRYPAIPTPALLAPAPPIHPHIATPNGITPLFVLPPSAMPYPSAVPMSSTSSAWPGPPPPRHPSPSLPFSGTGVFLPPPVSGNSSSAQLILSSGNEANLAGETKTSMSVKPNHCTSASPKEQPDIKCQTEDCNGSIEASLSNGAVAIEESKAENV